MPRGGGTGRRRRGRVARALRTRRPTSPAPAAAQRAGPVVLVLVRLGGLAFELGQPGGVVELGVLVAAAPSGPLAALSPPAHRYAATLPVLVEE
jgi:hypothetical protein